MSGDPSASPPTRKIFDCFGNLPGGADPEKSELPFGRSGWVGVNGHMARFGGGNQSATILRDIGHGWRLEQACNSLRVLDRCTDHVKLVVIEVNDLK